jgi:large subunit ribosomal protein L32
MAVPKKRTSKMKTRLRKAQWKAQANLEAAKALSKAKTVIKSLLSENSSTQNANPDELNT